MNGIAVGLRASLSALARTWRVSTRYAGRLETLRADGVPHIVVLWHRSAVPLFWWHRHQGTALLVSRNRDGGVLAEAARRWGYELIRGSSSRGSVGALRQVIRSLNERREVAITPDGPRGPAGVAKPGAVSAAQAAGAVIVPVGLSVSRAWRLGSWDAVHLPRPFARLSVAYGEPFGVEPGREGWERGVAQLQGALDDASSLAACG